MKVACLVLVLVAACSKTSNQLPDEAWGVEDYAKAGLTIDKPWTADDFEKAATVLQQATADHRERLPHYHGTKSQAVFAKLVADLPDDSALPVGERFGPRMRHYLAVNAISKLYLPDQLATPPREWIDLMGALLREAVVLAQLAEPFLATFGSNDPSLGTRRGGLEKMKTGFGTMMLGGLLVADQLRVPEDDRVAMLRHVAAALPTLFPLAPADTQQQIRDVLAKEAAGFPQGKLRDAATAAQQALPK